MKFIAKVLAFTCAAMLAGCSKAPSNGDIKKNLEALFSCPAISVEDVEKTNGIDQGGTYSVSFSYKMVFPKGWKSNEEFKQLFAECPNSTIYLLGMRILGNGNGIGNVEDGKEVEVSGEKTMVKSENGWIFQ